MAASPTPRTETTGASRVRKWANCFFAALADQVAGFSEKSRCCTKSSTVRGPLEGFEFDSVPSQIEPIVPSSSSGKSGFDLHMTLYLTAAETSLAFRSEHGATRRE